MSEQLISIIIPALHEADRVVHLVGSLAGQLGVEVVVVDGDPLGTTVKVLEGLPCRCLVTKTGRASQMNAGADVAKGDILLFLHADSELPENWAAEVRAVLAAGFARCGSFSLRFSRGGTMGRIVAWWAGFRSRLDRRPYGDQAHFFRADFFRDLGGYADIPIMEDVEMMGRAVRLGLPPCILPSPVTTSARRLRAEGWLRRGLKNMLMRVRYAMGTPPEVLAKGYVPQQDEEETS